MKWLLAAVLFALAVVLTIGTAAIRADNVRARGRIEHSYRMVQDRIVELRRLGLERMLAKSPQRLAELHWQVMELEARQAGSERQ